MPYSQDWNKDISKYSKEYFQEEVYRGQLCSGRVDVCTAQGKSICISS